MSGQLEQDFLYIGQTWKRIVPLRVDGQPYDMTGASVTAQFTRISGTYATNNGPEVTCSSGGSSDYACGVVEVEVAESETSQLAAGNWTLEIRVTEAGGDVLIFQCLPVVSVVPTGHAI